MTFLRVIFGIVAFALLYWPASSVAQLTDNGIQADDPVVTQLIDFIETVESESRPEPEFVRSEYPTLQLTSDVAEAIIANNPAALDAAILNAQSRKSRLGNEAGFEAALSFANRIREIAPENFHGPQRGELAEYLSTRPEEDGWFLQSVGLLLAANLNIPKRDFVTASLFTENANAKIPSELSPYATEARLLASRMTALIHGLQGNTQFLLQSAKTEYEMRSQIGDEMNVHDLIVNFIYALNQERNFEGAARLGPVLERHDYHEVSFPGLGETYLAETFVELGEFEEAERLSRVALEQTDHPTIQNRVNSVLIVSLAGQGKITEARRIMVERDWQYTETQLLKSSEIIPRVILAEALIALNQDRAQDAEALFFRYTDRLINRKQATSGREMTSLLANLENTRERQLERETALKREAELKAVQLAQQKRLNAMLQIMLGLMFSALIAALIFLRYRERTNRQIHNLNDEALSAERMKNEFLGVVNHELRTPLNGIIGMADAMIHHAKDPSIRKQAQTIQDSGQVLFDMIRSLIDMSTLDNGQMTLDEDAFNVARILSEEADDWRRAADEKGLAYTYHIDPALDRRVVGDDSRLGQCIRILLSNAVRFTQDGRVHLHATLERDDNFTGLKIIVADTGQGMNEDVLKRLFKPFLQADLSMSRKFGGVGLNLAIARQLARKMGGDITVVSRQDRGSEFTFTASFPTDLVEKTPEKTAQPETCLAEPEMARNASPESFEPESTIESPVAMDDDRDKTVEHEPTLDTERLVDATETLSIADGGSADATDEELFGVVDLMIGDTAFEADTIRRDPQPHRKSSPKPLSALTSTISDSAGKRASILIVEDEASNRDVIKVLLEPEGYECPHVDNAQDALDLLSLRPVDLIIMDIRMPVMNGIEAIQYIRLRKDRTANIPIVVLTADAKSSTRVQAMKAGANLFLTKPVDRRTLLNAIEKGLEMTEPEAEPTPYLALNG